MYKIKKWFRDNRKLLLLIMSPFKIGMPNLFDKKNIGSRIYWNICEISHQTDYIVDQNSNGRKTLWPFHHKQFV